MEQHTERLDVGARWAVLSGIAIVVGCLALLVAVVTGHDFAAAAWPADLTVVLAAGGLGALGVAALRILVTELVSDYQEFARRH